jgi:hypothetical protein
VASTSADAVAGHVRIVMDGKISGEATVPFEVGGTLGRVTHVSGTLKGTGIWDSRLDRPNSMDLEWRGTMKLIQDVEASTSRGTMPAKANIVTEMVATWRVTFAYELSEAKK